MDKIFEWPRVLMNDLPLAFLLEVVFRSIVMFLILLVFLRLAGKRGVKQLSVFEVVIIVGLGSAVGDPMLYDNVGLLPGIVVVIVVILFYRLITILTAKFKWVERFLEGEPKCLIKDGEFVLNSLNKENLASNEFFSELRNNSVEHLGQIRFAYLETSGEVSIFYNKDEDVTYGLPILPELFKASKKEVTIEAHYGCTFCGHIQYIKAKTQTCERCRKEEWVKALNSVRIS
ncbi:MAG: YetF domain-containing protein [Aquaticitalea sp.]